MLLTQYTISDACVSRPVTEVMETTIIAEVLRLYASYVNTQIVTHALISRPVTEVMETTIIAEVLRLTRICYEL
jgi:hypothetical protein